MQLVTSRCYVTVGGRSEQCASETEYRRASSLAARSIATSKYGTDGSFIKVMLSMEVGQSSAVVECVCA